MRLVWAKFHLNWFIRFKLIRSLKWYIAASFSSIISYNPEKMLRNRHWCAEHLTISTLTNNQILLYIDTADGQRSAGAEWCVSRLTAMSRAGFASAGSVDACSGAVRTQVSIVIHDDLPSYRCTQSQSSKGCLAFSYKTANYIFFK